MADIQELRELLSKHDHTDVIKRKLKTLDQSAIETEDSAHFNFLHYAIQANNLEAVYLLFGHGCFGSHIKPGCVPYLHLACLHGNSSVLGALLKYRPHDISYKIPASAEEFRNVCHRHDMDSHKSGGSDMEGTVASRFDSVHDQDLWAIDVAAEYEHLKCVKLLLDLQIPQSCCLLEKAIKLPSTKSVMLLLKAKESDQDSINKAFKLALIRKQADCVELLLKCGAEPEAVLNGMNAYHTMYMYSSAFQLGGPGQRNKGLADTTAVLLKHGLPINTYNPPGTYPLYSLIQSLVQELDLYPSELPTEHYQSLKLLLEAGADPNLDEELKVEYETSANADDEVDIEQFIFDLTVGRDLYSSGLKALHKAIAEQMRSEMFDPAHIASCYEILLQHGADPNKSGTIGIGETPLHAVVRRLAQQQSSRNNWNANHSCIIGTLLQYGANPNGKATNNMYAFNYYFMILFNMISGSAFVTFALSDCCKQIFHLLYFMDHSKALDACSELLTSCYNSHQVPNSGYMGVKIPTPVITYLEKQVEAITGNPRDLRFLSYYRLWVILGRSLTKLEELPIPTPVKRNITNMFHTAYSGE